MSEYTLPELPLKPPLLTPLSTEKKSLLIVKPTIPAKSIVQQSDTSQKTISVFLTKTPSSSSSVKSLEARKSSLLNRIKQKTLIPQIDKSASAAWDRGEWLISNLFMYSLTSPPQPPRLVS